MRRSGHALWGGDRTPEGEADLPWLGRLLAPAEWLFRWGAAARNAWHDRRRPEPAPMPVVSVGNLVVGGAGKTPVVRWLGEWLRDAGAQAAVIARGYGDEVQLHRRWAGEPSVFAGADRRALVVAAHEDGHRIALLDDGFQHRRVARDLDVVLVAAEDPARVRLLPRGPYREPLGSVRRATHVLVTRRTAAPAEAAAWRERLARVAPGVPAAEIRMEMGPWTDLAGDRAAAPSGDVLAVCSVARPGAFAAGLRDLLGAGAGIELAWFPDHHDFSERDVRMIRERRAGRTVVCTEKDAVKLARWSGALPGARAVGFRVADPVPEALAAALARACEDDARRPSRRPGRPAGAAPRRIGACEDGARRPSRQLPLRRRADRDGGRTAAAGGRPR